MFSKYDKTNFDPRFDILQDLSYFETASRTILQISCYSGCSDY